MHLCGALCIPKLVLGHVTMIHVIGLLLFWSNSQRRSSAHAEGDAYERCGLQTTLSSPSPIVLQLMHFPTHPLAIFVSYCRKSRNTVTQRWEQRGSTAVERRCGRRRRNACNPPSSSYEDRCFGAFNPFKTQYIAHVGTLEVRGLRCVPICSTYSALHGNHSRPSSKLCSLVQAKSAS